MAQLSRPYQIALAALGLFALVWFAALHRPGSGPGSGPGSSPSSSSAPAVAAKGASPAAPTSVYHGAAPGVEGLTRAVAKAHGAVGQSEQNAQQLQSKSAQASGEAAPARTGSVPGAGAPATQQRSTTTSPAVTQGTQAHKPSSTHGSASATAGAQQAAQQTVLQGELKHGKTVLLLFWNPKSTDDASVRHQVQAVGAHLKGRVAVHLALAGQVGQYASVTRDVQVYQTPTLLIVGKKGLAVTMTGLVDQYAIEQAITEVQKASKGTSPGA